MLMGFVNIILGNVNIYPDWMFKLQLFYIIIYT